MAWRETAFTDILAPMTMIDLKELEVWFITGSQHLYGPEALKQVAANSQEIARALEASPGIPVKVIFKPVVTTPGEATALCQEANRQPRCIGLITWCHTFSPSKMWINGLKLLRKPLAHLHTQYNRDIPWGSIDMDFMNLNQAAHGDREHGFIMSRMRLDRKVVAGYWQDPAVQARLGAWSRAAAAWHDWQEAKFCRFGDNMRAVAVTALVGATATCKAANCPLKGCKSTHSRVEAPFGPATRFAWVSWPAAGTWS